MQLAEIIPEDRRKVRPEALVGDVQHQAKRDVWSRTPPTVSDATCRRCLGEIVVLT